MLRGMYPQAAILGCAGPTLTRDEVWTFRRNPPLGFILFARNLENREQIADLVGHLRSTVGRDDAPVLIDQEGGRVARLRGDGWWDAPPAGRFGALARTALPAACEAARLNARLIADDLASAGIDVDCAPVLDLDIAGAHQIIGDRSYGGDPVVVAALGRAVCEGLLAGGVLPVVKHIPGHGRSAVDSHLALPRVDAEREVLDAGDFEPFRLLADLPMAMTAHIVYAAVDVGRAATVSAAVIAQVIRGAIGFDGLLMSDDLGMHALDGDLGNRVRAALNAGCDIALHCSGVAEDNAAVLEAAPRMTEQAMVRWQRAAAMRHQPEPFDRAAAIARVEELLSAAAA